MERIQNRNQGGFGHYNIGSKQTNVNDVNLGNGTAAAANLRKLSAAIFAAEIQSKPSEQSRGKPLHQLCLLLNCRA
jgi:hypothetical protein